MKRSLNRTTFLLALLFVSSCERGQPQNCSDLIEPGDFGSFEMVLGGIARDKDNRREWYRCSLGQRFNGSSCVGKPQLKTVEETLVIIGELNQKSGTSWRLPSLKELRSLVVEGCGNPAVNPNVFPGILVENYWASDESSASGFRCGMYTYLGATSCRLFNSLERPSLLVRDY